jgi:hypothetical protein
MNRLFVLFPRAPFLQMSSFRALFSFGEKTDWKENTFPSFFLFPLLSSLKPIWEKNNGLLNE